MDYWQNTFNVWHLTPLSRMMVVLEVDVSMKVQSIRIASSHELMVVLLITVVLFFRIVIILTSVFVKEIINQESCEREINLVEHGSAEALSL